MCVSFKFVWVHFFILSSTKRGVYLNPFLFLSLLSDQVPSEAVPWSAEADLMLRGISFFVATAPPWPSEGMCIPFSLRTPSFDVLRDLQDSNNFL
jgi:hypothetical protein